MTYPFVAESESDSDDFLAAIATCRVCGCDDDHACEGGCWWVEADLCSACVDADGSTVDASDDELMDVDTDDHGERTCAYCGQLVWIDDAYQDSDAHWMCTACYLEAGDGEAD